MYKASKMPPGCKQIGILQNLFHLRQSGCRYGSRADFQAQAIKFNANAKYSPYSSAFSVLGKVALMDER